ncbi:tautomerase family protein [Peribacillus loiseleuriae]|uniref:tautomerase family protein n=1 Tax=Peribacillus loiseleuriae TaxID=1679170 RepID=UPI0038143EC2
MRRCSPKSFVISVRHFIVHQHPAHELIIEEDGFERSKDLVVLNVTSKQRSDDQKKNFYKILVQELGEIAQEWIH